MMALNIIHTCMLTIPYNRVSDLSHANKMRPDNLALIFAPTLFRSGNNDIVRTAINDDDDDDDVVVTLLVVVAVDI